jgi:SulP family sulfate permease
MFTSIVVTLTEGVELGILSGVALSILIHLYRTSRPHCAIVGQVPGSEHFRNILRHKVVTSPTVLNLRVDESLYFPNARFLEDKVQNLVAENPEIRHVVLMCPAVNSIDASALESLEAINARLRDSNVTLHFSEIKGPVMDQLQRSHFLQELTGKVYLSQYDAFSDLDPQAARTALAR